MHGYQGKQLAALLKDHGSFKALDALWEKQAEKKNQQFETSVSTYKYVLLEMPKLLYLS